MNGNKDDLRKQIVAMTNSKSKLKGKSNQVKERYLQAFERFFKYLTKEYQIQNFDDIQAEHLESYEKELQKRDHSIAFIKTELYAIQLLLKKTS